MKKNNSLLLIAGLAAAGILWYKNGQKKQTPGDSLPNPVLPIATGEPSPTAPKTAAPASADEMRQAMLMQYGAKSTRDGVPLAKILGSMSDAEVEDCFKYLTEYLAKGIVLSEQTDARLFKSVKQIGETYNLFN
ncbi:MAG: hypothetical protein EOP50_00505 [Sphingobacteriales bacterium]|nr:MAG: hypothetical protein EOP50_00505 [Sphingobacteriales bacterium]